jgi:hypothetical protein
VKPWLTEDAVADVGQEEDFEAARAKALKVGAKKFILDVRDSTIMKALRSVLKPGSARGIRQGIDLSRCSSQCHLRGMSTPRFLVI